MSGGSGAAGATPARLLAREILAEARTRDAFVRELVESRRRRYFGDASVRYSSRSFPRVRPQQSPAVSSTDTAPAAASLSAAAPAPAVPPARDSREPRTAVPEISREDFNFAQVLVFGVTMCSGTLDEALNARLDSPRSVRPKLRDALRISAYELIFLGKPAHVAVNQGVELARSVEPRAAGLANAVLRRLAADAPTFPWGNPLSDDAALSRCHGVPEWLATRLTGELGRTRASSVLAACLEPPPTYLAANPFDPDSPFPSDLAAQQVASLVPLGGEVLEIGAGRGTKTMLLEARSMAELGRTTSIHTVDSHAYKQRILEERLAAYGIDSVTAHTGDARDLVSVEGLPQSFDAVLVDAPCSGTGTLRRHPEIRWRLEPEDVTVLADLQYALLAQAASRCRAGGTVVYSTCSILAEENEGVVERFMRSELGESFAIEPVRPGELLGAQAAAAARAPGVRGGWGLDEQSITSWGCFSSLPEDSGPDGHFAARFHRFQ